MYLDIVKLSKKCLIIIKYLKDKQYKIIIASNGPSTAIPAKLKGLGINEYIDETFAADECGSMKPHAYFYEALFNKINNHNTKEMLFIGDQGYFDLYAGKLAGARTMLVSPYYIEDQGLWDIRKNTLEELKEFLGKM